LFQTILLFSFQAAARAVLKKHSMMLLTASKAYVRHPELAAAKANRDFVLRQVSTIHFLFPFSKVMIVRKSSI
jgi:hypothetical protein